MLTRWPVTNEFGPTATKRTRAQWTEHSILECLNVYRNIVVDTEECIIQDWRWPRIVTRDFGKTAIAVEDSSICFAEVEFFTVLV